MVITEHLVINQCFFIDEYASLIEQLNKTDRKQVDQLMYYVLQLALLVRQLEFFIFVAMQEPQAIYFENGARNNFEFRLLLGRAKSTGHYTMMLGDSEKAWLSQEESVRSWGYLFVDPNDPVMFFPFNIPANFSFMDFFDEIGLKFPAKPLDQKKKY